MKIIKYQLMTEINQGTEEYPDIVQSFSDKEMDWSESNEETAKREAYNGEYTIEDDGRPEPPPTTEQRVSDLEEQLVQADETSISLYEALQEQETINIQQDEALVDADETSIGLYESQQEQETINAQQDEALMEIYEMLG